MPRRKKISQHPRTRSERGMALITTVLILTLMGALAITALVAASGGATVAAQDQSYSAALGAADAGVDDLLYRLNANENTSFELAENIYDYDKQLSSSPSTSCPTTDTPAVPPAACGWVTIPDDNDSARTHAVRIRHPVEPLAGTERCGHNGRCYRHQYARVRRVWASRYVERPNV